MPYRLDQLIIDFWILFIQFKKFLQYYSSISYSIHDFVEVIFKDLIKVYFRSKYGNSTLFNNLYFHNKNSIDIK